jgi:hypothetical protein
MRARLMIIAATALTVGTSALADPPKSREAQAAQPASPPAQVLMASVESGDPAPAADQAPPPVKRPRVARVTSCRCGDQQASDQQ